MKFFGWEIKKFSTPPPPASKGTPPSTSIAYKFQGFSLGGYTLEGFYADVYPFAQSVDLIATACKAIPLKWLKPDGTEEDNNEVLDFLGAPADYLPQDDFLSAIFVNYLVDGVVPLILDGLPTRPPIGKRLTARKWLAPYTTDTVPYHWHYYVNSQPEAGQGFSWQNGILVPNGGNPLRELVLAQTNRLVSTALGVPIGSSVLAQMTQVFVGANYNVGLMRNGGSLSVLITPKNSEGMTDQQMNELAAAFKAAGAGVENVGNVVAANSEMSVQDWGANNREMQWLEGQESAAKAIYKRFNIPIPLTDASAATFSNMQTAALLFSKQAVLPTWRAVWRQLSAPVARRFGVDGQIVPDVSRLTEIALESIQVAQSMSLTGGFTRGEIREAAGYAPLDGEGNNEIITSTLQARNP